MKRCPKCEAQFDESFSFCGKCGAKLESAGIDLRKKDGNSSPETDDSAGDSLIESTQASFQAGKYSDCVRQLEKAIKSGVPGAKRLYGCFLDDSEDFRRAVERYYYSDRIIQQSPSSSSGRTRQTQAYFGLSRKRRTAIICSALLVLGAGIGGSVWWTSYHSPESYIRRGKEALRQNRYQDAADSFRQAAEKGHAAAQYGLGDAYMLSQSFAEAVNWYSKAAEQGLAVAQFKLGLCYEKGWGVEKNVTEAEKWYSKAAEQGNEDAKKRLGFLPSLGRMIGL